MGKKNRYPLIEELEIIDIGLGGKSVAKHNDVVIFVNKTVPGDIVDVQINKKRKNLWEGYPVKFRKYSDNRVEAFCSHFGVCGGCRWQNLSYQDQLKFKQKQVVDNLERIAGVKLPSIKQILPSFKTDYYRNKLEYTFTNMRWLEKEEIDMPELKKPMKALGFHVPGRFDKIVDIDHCYLQPDPSNSIRLAIREYGIKNGISFFDLRNHNGILRNIIIRTTLTGETMLIVVFYHEEISKRTGLLDYILEKFPDITSLMYVINPKGNSTLYDRDIKLHYGREYIEEEMEGAKFRIGPKSFFQTNSMQALELYKIVREFASLKGDEIVYDLYTGTGTIANFIAGKCKKVIGIDSVPEAIKDADINSEINSVSNTEFIVGDIKDVLSIDFFNEKGKPEVVILEIGRAHV